MRYIVVDFEMNPVSRVYKEQKAICTNEIIQIGAVLLDENYQEKDSFQTYVKPRFSTELRRSIVRLTGITERDLYNAPHFVDAINSFLTWIGNDDYTIYAWSETDKEQFCGECVLNDACNKFEQLIKLFSSTILGFL